MLTEERKRIAMPKLNPEERVCDFSEVELGYSEIEAKTEARRCLTCNVGICVGCKICAEICPNSVIRIETEFDPEERRYVKSYTMDIGKCLFCAYCAEACPTKCLQLSKLYELADYQKNFDFDLERLRISKERQVS